MKRRGTPGGDISDDPRLMAGFICLVGASSGSMALFGGGSLSVVGLAVLSGLAVGGCLLWYVRRLLR